MKKVTKVDCCTFHWLFPSIYLLSGFYNDPPKGGPTHRGSGLTCVVIHISGAVQRHPIGPGASAKLCSYQPLALIPLSDGLIDYKFMLVYSQRFFDVKTFILSTQVWSITCLPWWTFLHQSAGWMIVQAQVVWTLISKCCCFFLEYPPIPGCTEQSHQRDPTADSWCPETGRGPAQSRGKRFACSSEALVAVVSAFLCPGSVNVASPLTALHTIIDSPYQEIYSQVCLPDSVKWLFLFVSRSWHMRRMVLYTQRCILHHYLGNSR